jgi:hypothetical protein
MGQLVSANYFSVLGVSPAIGRGFIPEEDQERRPVVVLGHAFWRERFGSDPAVLERTMKLNGQFFRVVGITPSGFVGTSLQGPDVWIPLAMQPLIMPGKNQLDDRGARWLEVVGRLRPGVTRAKAQTSLAVVAHLLAQAYPDTNKKAGIVLTSATALHPEARRVIKIRATGQQESQLRCPDLFVELGVAAFGDV